MATRSSDGRERDSAFRFRPAGTLRATLVRPFLIEPQTTTVLHRVENGGGSTALQGLPPPALGPAVGAHTALRELPPALRAPLAPALGGPYAAAPGPRGAPGPAGAPAGLLVGAGQCG